MIKEKYCVKHVPKAAIIKSFNGRGKTVWQIYDDLIHSIPEKLTVLECMIGVSWTLVRSEYGLGAAKTIKGGKKGTGLRNISGMKVNELAQYVKSWNMLEASIGQAAINSVFNNKLQVMPMVNESMFSSDHTKNSNAFDLLEPELKDKKVAVIGHFHGIERLNNTCELSILEREPQEGDYPDSACEYLLPEQDFVFITGTAFTNKTMPRLIELSKKSKIVLVGPSVPTSKILFDYGIFMIAGFIAEDRQMIWKAVQEGEKMNIFKYGGRMICLRQ